MLKALSLWQPWASLMAVNAKMIETRSWSTDYRGFIAIHAAKRFQEMERLLLGQKRFYNALMLDTNTGGDEYPPSAETVAEALPLGCFVAVGRLVDCLSTSPQGSFLAKIPDESTDEFWFGDYSPRRFMWVFDEIWKLRAPVYSRGYQGLWTIPDSGLLDEIEDKLPEPQRPCVIDAKLLEVRL